MTTNAVDTTKRFFILFPGKTTSPSGSILVRWPDEYWNLVVQCQDRQGCGRGWVQCFAYPEAEHRSPGEQRPFDPPQQFRQRCPLPHILQKCPSLSVPALVSPVPQQSSHATGTAEPVTNQPVRMRVKRQKQYRKSMAVYANAFKFREPYQVLVDGTFIAAALKLRADIYSSLSSVLVATAKPMTTQCVIEELRSLGEDMSGAVIAGKRLERRRCVHEKTVPAAECLKLIIGEENQFNYCVATQDIELRRHFRKVPGVPLVYINKSVFILEPVSTATERKIADLEKQKTLPKPQEVKILKKMADPNYDEAAEAAAAAAAAAQAEKDKKRKKREKKLLAIKKLRLKKRKLAQTEGTVAKGKRKRDDDQNGEKSDFSESGGEGGVKERSIGEVSAKRRKQVKKVVKVEEGEEAEEVKS